MSSVAAIYVHMFVTDLADNGLPLEGYRAAPDKLVAFQTLASRLLSSKKDKELAALLEEHGKEHAQTLTYQRDAGELHLLRQEYAAAPFEPIAILNRGRTPLHHWPICAFRTRTPDSCKT
jgi:hypothetical protein